MTTKQKVLDALTSYEWKSCKEIAGEIGASTNIASMYLSNLFHQRDDLERTRVVKDGGSLYYYRVKNPAEAETCGTLGKAKHHINMAMKFLAQYENEAKSRPMNSAMLGVTLSEIINMAARSSLQRKAV